VGPVSVTVDLTERQLRLGILKIGLSLAMLLIIVAFVLSLLAGKGQQLVIDVLFVSVSFGFLTNGVLAVLRIMDWFENRARRNG
jgi:hypothetical protein